MLMNLVLHEKRVKKEKYRRAVEEVKKEEDRSRSRKIRRMTRRNEGGRGGVEAEAGEEE